MKSYRIIFVLLLLLCSCFFPLPSIGIATAHSGLTPGQQSEPLIPLEGLDPVMLSRGKEVLGNLKISVTRGPYQYVFANEENKALFEKSPEQYEIQLGGTCARMGPMVGGNADLYSVHQGRIYIFGSGGCKKLFDAAPEKYLEPAPQKELSATPEAMKKGQALIDKAVVAMGGAAKLDGLTGYQEMAAATAIQQQNPVEYKTSLTRVFPDSIRREDVRNFGTVTNIAVPVEAFGIFKTATRTAVNPMRPLAAAEFRKLTHLSPLEILHARKSPDFKAAFVGSSTAAGVTVDEVAILLDGATVRLGIDATSGRIVTLTYRGRSRSAGELGEIKKVYSDFRTVDGLTLPYKTQGTFNGQAEAEQTYTIESISFNVKVEPSLFEKPKPTGAQ